MSRNTIRAAALRDLSRKLQDGYTEAQEAVDSFCGNVNRYNQLSLGRKRTVGNRLRALTGRKGLRLIECRTPTGKLVPAGTDDRKSIADLLADPSKWINRLRQAEAHARLSNIPETAARITCELFREDMLKGVERLAIALTCSPPPPTITTTTDASGNPVSDVSYWRGLWEKVIPALRQDFPQRFNVARCDQGFEILRDSWVACELLADATGKPRPLSRPTKGRPQKSNVENDQQIAEQWYSYLDTHGGHAKYADFAKDSGHDRDTVKRAVDRHRHRHRKRKLKSAE